MPMSLAYVGDGGVIARGEGVVTGRDLKKLNEIVYASPEDIKKISYQICDLTRVSELNISSSDVRELSMQDKQASQLNPNMLVALVAEKDVVFGFSRMWEALSDDSPYESKVFRRMEDAHQWIRERLQEKP